MHNKNRMLQVNFSIKHAHNNNQLEYITHLGEIKQIILRSQVQLLYLKCSGKQHSTRSSPIFTNSLINKIKESYNSLKNLQQETTKQLNKNNRPIIPRCYVSEHIPTRTTQEIATPMLIATSNYSGLSAHYQYKGNGQQKKRGEIS